MGKKSKHEPDQWSDLLKKLPQWWQIAVNHARANDSWSVIKPDTPQWQAWDEHFRKTGYRPAFFRPTAQAVTMPAASPDDIPGLQYVPPT
jgi:hypothetical protein